MSFAPKRSNALRRYGRLAQRYNGDDRAILGAHHDVYQKARQQHPARWSGQMRNWSPVAEMTLNPERDTVIKADLAGAHI